MSKSEQQKICMKLPAVYGDLTWKERRDVRNEYVRLQRGVCSYCGDPLDGKPSAKIDSMKINLRLFPPNFMKHPIHLHHNHDTGLTIGAVHNKCNAVLWQYDGE